jgi:hypothetical protein
MTQLQLIIRRWLLIIIPFVVLIFVVAFSEKIPSSIGYRLCTAFSGQFAMTCPSTPVRVD